MRQRVCVCLLHHAGCRYTIFLHKHVELVIKTRQQQQQQQKPTPNRLQLNHFYNRSLHRGKDFLLATFPSLPTFGAKREDDATSALDQTETRSSAATPPPTPDHGTRAIDVAN